MIDWLIAVLRKLVSYEARAAAIQHDREQLAKDISAAIAAKEKRVLKLEQQIAALEHIQF